MTKTLYIFYIFMIYIISPVTALMLTPLLLTFSNTEKRVNVYSVPAVRFDIVWVTAPSPSGALMYVSVPLNWRTKLTLLLTLFHCRVILVSSCADGLKLSVFSGANKEKQSKEQCYKYNWHVLSCIISTAHYIQHLVRDRGHYKKQHTCRRWS